MLYSQLISFVFAFQLVWHVWLLISSVHFSDAKITSIADAVVEILWRAKYFKFEMACDVLVFVTGIYWSHL